MRVVTEASSPLRYFGECADSSCGCYRLREPRVRGRFRNAIVARTNRQLGGGAPVRYVSIGSGALLTDVEILSGLVESGHRIEYCTRVPPFLLCDLDQLE